MLMRAGVGAAAVVVVVQMASVHMMTAPLEKKEIAAFVKKYAKTKVPRHYRKGLPSKPRPFKG